MCVKAPENGERKVAAAKKQKKSGSKPKRKGGLPKKYIKAASGDMKKAWAMYKSGKKPKKSKAAAKPKKSKAAAKPKKSKAAAKPKKSKAAAKPKKTVTKTTVSRTTTRASEKKSPEVRLAILIAKQKSDLATLQARYEARRVALVDRLGKASSTEKTRLETKLQLLLAERDAVVEKYQAKAKLDKERIKQLEAAEAAEHMKKHKSKKRKKGKEKNPISGWGESLSTVGGVALGGILLVVGDSLIANRGNLQLNGTQLADQPAANGGVYMLSAQSLPVWKQFKHAGAWRILWALFNTGAPLTAAHFLAKAGHNKWAAFFQGWGYTDVGISVAKVSTDGLAMALGTKSFGFKAFPAQLAAINMAANASALPAGTALTPMPVQAGSAGKLGYGTAPSAGVLGAGKAGCPHVGAGEACCSNCALSKQIPRSGAGPQQPTCPPSGTPQAPAAPPTNPLSPIPYQGQAPTPTPPSTPVSTIPYQGQGAPASPSSPSTLGAQGAPNNVTPIHQRKGSSLRAAGTGTRFDRSKFGF
jgi:hypothetical protein